MCGIFAFLGKGVSKETLKEHCDKIQHRGPDITQYKDVTDEVFFGFHRLAINGLDHGSDQPFEIDGKVLICNGEIYNFKELGEQFGFEYQTHSDCEVIIHLYKHFNGDMTQVCQHLDGVFAFGLYDSEKDTVFVARDHLGIRPLYIGRTDDGEIALASEAKSLTFCSQYSQFPPRCWWCLTDPDLYNSYYRFEFDQLPAEECEEGMICNSIRELFTEAVRKRFIMADVEVGCLLSGGLDSSLVTAICAGLTEDPSTLKTFSIGMSGSPDLEAAQKVADFLGTDHYSVELSEQEFLDAIENTVYALGSFDITTIRASVGHKLVSQWVRDHTNVKVLFSGEVADECSGSYAYFCNAPSPEEFQKESIWLMREIHLYDGLRSDRSISSAGLESRVPFSDKDFLAYYMRIPPEMKMFDTQKIEKYLLRKAFDGILPDSVLWRKKNGFSDGCSNVSRSWSVIVQEMVDQAVSDEEYESERLRYTEKIRPNLKEGYYYMKLFEQWYGPYDEYAGTWESLTPYQWLPKWCGDVVDPSARVLSCYAAD